MRFDPDDPRHKVVSENSSFVDVVVGDAEFHDRLGRIFVQKDYRLRGDVWRVHKGDADPLPSSPHAHCIEGRFEGQTLHLGTGELYRGRQARGLYLDKKQFARLIELIRPKFPGLQLPLPA